MIDGNVSEFIDKITFQEEAEGNTQNKCMEKLLNDSIIEGKSFWEAESDMKWIEW